MTVKNLVHYNADEYPEPPGHFAPRCDAGAEGWVCTIDRDIHHEIHEASEGAYICATWEGSDHVSHV